LTLSGIQACQVRGFGPGEERDALFGRTGCDSHTKVVAEKGPKQQAQARSAEADVAASVASGKDARRYMLQAQVHRTEAVICSDPFPVLIK